MVFRRFKFNGRHILVITVSVMSIIVKSLSYDVVKKMTKNLPPQALIDSSWTT